MASRLLIAIQSQIWRSTGIRVASAQLRRPDFEVPLDNPIEKSATLHQWQLYQHTANHIKALEQQALKAFEASPNYQHLISIKGVGPILGMTIGLETGDIHRFACVGDYASYCRCVQANRYSNGKKKGHNNRKAGNKYLSWAFSEAAHFAVRFNPEVQRFYQRKQAKTNRIIAIRAVAHKLARAVWHMLMRQQPFNVQRAFAS